MKRTALLFIILISLVESGCATMLIGKSQFIQVMSDPPGATVQVDKVTATTPAIISLKRKYDYVATIEKEGYERVYAKIESRFNGGALLNLLILFFPGLIIDASTGASCSLVPKELNIKLKQMPLITEGRPPAKQ